MTFKKGQSGNPKGRPPIVSKDLQDAIAKDRSDIRALVRSLLCMTKGQRALYAQRPEATTIEEMFCEIIDKAKLDGDHIKTGWLFSVGYGDMTKPDQPILTPEQMTMLGLFEQWQAKRALEPPHGGAE